MREREKEREREIERERERNRERERERGGGKRQGNGNEERGKRTAGKREEGEGLSVASGRLMRGENAQRGVGEEGEGGWRRKTEKSGKTTTHEYPKHTHNMFQFPAKRRDFFPREFLTFLRLSFPSSFLSFFFFVLFFFVFLFSSSLSSSFSCSLPLCIHHFSLGETADDFGQVRKDSVGRPHHRLSASADDGAVNVWGRTF